MPSSLTLPSSVPSLAVTRTVSPSLIAEILPVSTAAGFGTLGEAAGTVWATMAAATPSLSSATDRRWVMASRQA